MYKTKTTSCPTTVGSAWASFMIIFYSFFFTNTIFAKQWLEVELGIIGPSSDDILLQASQEVVLRNYEGLIIKLDTPGGSLESTRSMVKTILNSSFPIIVWVGPSGAHAGSAGAFITLSAHVAAMAPGTNIGAAHPVQATGQDIGEGDIGEKVMNDTLAFMESIAKSRNRDLEVARSFVSSSVSISSDEALKKNVIDVIASDIPELLSKIDGKEIILENDKKMVLETKNVSTQVFQKSLRQKLLEILSNPNLFYLLFMAGIIGLGYELTHPGILFPGVVGAICLLLSFIATSVLPISFGAAGLIILGMGLLIAEVFIPSFGILGIGGFTALVIGSVFLVDPANEQGLRLSWFVIGPGVLLIGLLSLGIGFLVFRSTRAKIVSGQEALIGSEGIVVENFSSQEGQIRVHGEIWQAKLIGEKNTLPIKNEKLRVKGQEGLILLVE